MPDGNFFFQYPASAANDELAASMSDDVFQDSSCHRRTDAGMNESQPFALIFSFIKVVQSVFPVIGGDDFGLFFPDNFFDDLIEKNK